MDILVKVLADGLILPIVAVAGYALVARVSTYDRSDRYTYVFMAGITSYMLAKFIGSIWQPEQLRPFEQLGVNPGASYLNNPGFPSDHALFGVFLVLAVLFATRSYRLTAVLAVLVVAMCIGRVLALVHTPLDRVGAFVVAGVGALWYVAYGKIRSVHTIARRAKK